MKKPVFDPLCPNKLLGLLLMMFTTAACLAQTPSSNALPDSLYQQGLFAEAAGAYQQQADLWETANNTDSLLYCKLMEAKCFIQQNRHGEAVQRLQKLLDHPEIRQKTHLLSRAYHELALTLINRGELHSAQDFSGKSIATELGRAVPDTFQLAKSYELKGFILLQSGSYDSAEYWVGYAHQLRREILDPLDKELGYSANTFYIVLSALGKLERADTVIAEAWKILHHNLPEEHPHIAVIANNYSTHLIDRGDLQQARKYLLQAISSNEKGRRPLLLAQNYVNLGLLYLNLNQGTTAEGYYRQAWQIADTLIAPPDYQRANIKDALGAAFYQQEKYELADSMFLMALEEKQAIYDQNSAEMAQSYFNLGLIAQERQEWEKAKGFYQQAAQIRANTLGADHPKRGDALFGLGEVAWKMGNLQQAVDFWKSSLGIYRKLSGLSHHHSLENLLRLATSYQQLQQPDSLQRYLHLAWGSVCGLVEPVENLSEVSEKGIEQYSPFVLELALFHLNLFVEKNQRLSAPDGEHILHIFHAVYPWLSEFIALYGAALPGENVNGLVQSFYRRIALLAHRMLETGTADSQEWQNLLLTCVEASRGATIQAAFRERQAIQFAGVPDSLVKQSQAIQQQLQHTRSRLQQAEDPATAEALLQLQNGTMQRWQELQQHFQENYPRYYQARYENPSAEVATLQSQLQQAGQLAVAWFYLDTALLAVHLQPEGFGSHLLPISPGMADSLQRYRELSLAARPSPEMGRLGHWLYKALWEPLELPPSAAPIKILPDGPLYYVNFEALLSELPEKNTSMGQWPWLLQRHCFFYGHSLAARSGGMEMMGNGGKVLGIAPGFTPELKGQYLKQLPEGQQPDSVFLRWLRTPWSLAFVEKLEEQNLGVSLTGITATESALDEAKSRAGVLHFGTHARLENRSPLKSFLALTPEPQKGRDGYLYTWELYGQQVPARLAVLTACETGLGEYQQGEGVLSLAHAFRYAGCPAVVYSLWSIDDQQTNLLTERFYHHLREGLPAAEALRQAKLDFLQDTQAGYAAPYFWAGLVLTGENMPVSFSEYAFPNASLYLISGSVVLLLMGGALIFRSLRRR